MINLFFELFSWRTVLDILIITLALFFVYKTLRRLGTWKILLGILLALVIYVIAILLELDGVIWFYINVSQVAVIGFIILFQPEIRKLFEVAVSRRRSDDKNDESLAMLISETVEKLAREKTGALIILPGKESIDSHLVGGQKLDAELSLPIVLSIFDPHSPGHDGAIIIENGKISKFGMRLPISSRDKLSRDFGTRHYAAAGLSEVSDAIIIAVSEEKGTITLFSHGKDISLQGKDKLMQAIKKHWYNTQSYLPQLNREKRYSVWAELSVSFLIACAFWYSVVIGEAEIREKVVTIPVEYIGTPKDLALTGSNLSEVQVHLVGPKSSLDKISDYRVKIDLTNTLPGTKKVLITEENINLVKKVKLVDVKPSSLSLDLVKMVEKELPVKPQMVGKLPGTLKIASIEVIPNKLKTLVKANDTKNQELVLTTTPIQLEEITRSVSLIRKIVVSPGVQPLDKKWPEVEIKINVVNKSGR